MLVTFNPNLSNKYSRNNCCGEKQTSFKQIVPEKAAYCAKNASTVGYMLIAKREPVNADNLSNIRKAIALAEGETQDILKQILQNHWGVTA